MICEMCGCTDEMACIDINTGEPCHWRPDDPSVCSCCDPIGGPGLAIRSWPLPGETAPFGELLLARPKVEMVCYCASGYVRFCPWPGLPDELVRCPACGNVPSALHDLGLDEHYVWDGSQYVASSTTTGG